MLILAPVFILILIAISLLILQTTRPEFKYPWLVAAGGALLALVAVGLWHLDLPQSYSLPANLNSDLFPYTPSWLADNISWIYALALVVLAASVIWTSVVRAESDQVLWAGSLLFTAMGLLAVTAGNPLTLVLTWTAMDVTELVTFLRSTDGKEQIQSIVAAFAVRLLGTGLVLWASTVSISVGIPMDFRLIPEQAGLFLLLAAGLRLGVLPLHLPNQQDNVLRRGLGTTFRLVSAASSLVLLARIPFESLKIPLTPYLLFLAAVAALYAGWMWLRASDELVGRPFLILGTASLAVAASLRADPDGSAAWGVALILGGGLLFLYSARQRGLLWLPVLALWGFTSLPYSPTASAWLTGNGSSWLYLLPLLPAQALLIAGFLRHSLHPGETSFESQARWTKIIYPTGLLLPAGTLILLGLWGWTGARLTGVLWAGPVVLLLSIGFAILALTWLVRASNLAGANRWIEIFRLNWIYRVSSYLFSAIGKVVDLVTSTIEGEGGILWSLLLLVLILSVFFSRSR